MRIVQVSVGSVRMPPEEGSAPLQVIFNTSRHLAREGHQVVILDRKYSKNDPAIEEIERIKIARLNVIQLPSSKAPGVIRFILAEFNAVLFALAVSSYLRKNSSDIDIIHLHLTSIGLIVSILNRRLRGEMFYTCHLGHWELVTESLSIFERVHLLLDPYLMRRVKKVIALNESAKDRFVSIAKVQAANIVVVPNGVDTEFFNPNIERKEAIERYGLEGKSTVLFVGRLAKIKGVEHLLRAAETVINGLGYSNTLFLLVGPPTFDATEKPVSMEGILSFIKEQRLDKNIIFTGPLPLEEVRALYAAADIFVLPSLAEGDPLVTLEAMASGKPIIGTRVGGIPHQIRDGWNGFLIEPGDEQQLAERIAYLLGNPEERKRMSLNSRKYAEEEFDWRRVAEKLSFSYQGGYHNQGRCSINDGNQNGDRKNQGRSFKK